MHDFTYRAHPQNTPCTVYSFARNTWPLTVRYTFLTDRSGPGGQTIDIRSIAVEHYDHFWPIAHPVSASTKIHLFPVVVVGRSLSGHAKGYPCKSLVVPRPSPVGPTAALERWSLYPILSLPSLCRSVSRQLHQHLSQPSDNCPASLQSYTLHQETVARVP